jgi:4-amino-4-deoxy-L-arabinose transferase-like glycosyltransferase
MTPLRLQFDQRADRVLWGILFSVCALTVGLTVVFQSYDHDEIEHVHTAWKILQGERIYLDFFQHHHPLLYAYLAPVIALCGEHAETVFACRLAMLPFFAGMLAASYLLAAGVFRNKSVGWLAVLLLLGNAPFVMRGTEIRPDVPQTFFELLGLALLFPWRGTATGYRYWLSGISLGISYVFLHKAVFMIAPAVLVVLWRIRLREAGWKSLGLLLLGIVIPIFPFYAWIVMEGAIGTYYFLNWPLNAHFLNHFSFLPLAVSVFSSQTVSFAFTAAACACFLSKQKHWELALVAACLFGSIMVVRDPYLQYWLPVLPMVAILGSYGLLMALHRRPPALLAVVAVSIGIPAIIFACSLARCNESFQQLQRIQYVLDIAEPHDSVYDGDARFNVFRKDIDYFWYNVGENHFLATYQTLRKYHYDVYELIDEKKPKLISSFAISNLDDPRIKDHYSKSERYDDLFIRTR